MFIRIETTSGLPITRQMIDQIRAHISSGLLEPGQQLPSVRALARQLAVNQNTILRVYEKLTAQGLLQLKHGQGTFVSDPIPAFLQKQTRQQLDQAIENTVDLASNLRLSPQATQQLIEKAFEKHTPAPETPGSPGSPGNPPKSGRRKQP